MESPETTPEPVPDAAVVSRRWYLRVLPVTGLLVLVIALLAAVVPGFRHQVELSVSRQSQPYVELYFARSSAADGQAVCTRRGSRAIVRFVVASHLDTSQPVAWRVVVRPAGKHSLAIRRPGLVPTRPDSASGVRQAFTVPRARAYTVSVALPSLGQHLRATCAGRHP